MTTRSSRRTAACRRRPRVRPRPRAARPLRHRRLGRQPGQLVDADGAKPGLGDGRPGHRHPSRRPGAWDKLQLGWLDYEVVLAGDGGRSSSGRTSTTARRRRVSSSCSPKRRSTTELATPFEGQRRGGAAPATATTPTMSGDAVAGRGATLTSRPTTASRTDFDYAYVEVDPGGPAGPACAGTNTDPTDRQRHRRGQRRMGAGVVRPVALRRADRRHADPLHHRRRRPWARTRAWPGPGSSSTPSRSGPGGDDGLRDGAEDRRQRLDLDGFQSVEASSPRCTTTTTWPRNRPTCRTTVPQDGSVQLRVRPTAGLRRALPLPGRAAGQLLGHVVQRQQHQRAPRVAAVLPIDSHPEATPTWRGSPGVVGSRPTTRHSGCRRPTRSRSTSTAKAVHRGQAGNRCSTTATPTGTSTPFAEAGQPRVGVKVAGVGVKIRVLDERGTSVKIRIS